MYQNCCKKCGSTSLYTEKKGNNTGLYCSDCGAWIKWLGKDEARAFEHSQKKPKTNRDKLSTMTNEELARLIARCDCCAYKRPVGCEGLRCSDGIRDWLEKEVEGNGA